MSALNFEGSLQWDTDKKPAVSIINIKQKKKFVLYGDGLAEPGRGVMETVALAIKKKIS